MKKMILLLTVILVTAAVMFAWADYRGSFEQAVSRGQYKGANDSETLDMITNVTRVLHEENQEIIERLKKIEEWLTKK